MKQKQGFTILETVLVLAVAAIIFVAAAITIPNLIRTQRDADRRATFGQLLSRISLYQANNRKALPEINAGTNPDGSVIDKLFMHWDDSINGYHNEIGGSTEWYKFVNNQRFLPDPFKDPNGDRYVISITTCNTSVGTGNSCNNTEYYKNQTTKQTIENFYKEHYPNDYTVLIVINAKCYSSEKLIATPGKRTAAVLYKLENGGTYCENN